MSQMSTSTNMSSSNQISQSSMYMRVSSALFYGICSFCIVVVNKVVLTSYGFPSYLCLALGQTLATIGVLGGAWIAGIITFPGFSPVVVKKIMPLPLIYMGNLVLGLGGTQKISLPMFVILRRFTILLTMIAEYYILGVKASGKVQFCVFLMIFGSCVAATNDLAFNLYGYIFILLNDFFTAANAVYTKKKLDAKDLGKYGVLFYNALFMVGPLSLLTAATGEFHTVAQFDKWTDVWFLSGFLLSCVMGFILNYSIVLCTQHNSALTTTIVGVLKNLFTTYLGMFIGGDYIFSWINFIGLNISTSGSLVYSYITFGGKKPPTPELSNASATKPKPAEQAPALPFTKEYKFR